MVLRPKLKAAGLANNLGTFGQHPELMYAVHESSVTMNEKVYVRNSALRLPTLRFQKGRNGECARGECGLGNTIRDLRRALIAEVELFN
uniref:Uncharacterized protein n=1 Tax=Vespula pensylvanica TaxID=30213 RepID=A0A834UHC2_VESPE|nr:hypothetical protein H0235_001550 [Vespula pensylvanica]